MRKLLGMLVVLALSVVLVACGGGESNDGEESNKLVVYSPNSEDIINMLIPKFEQETGIKVELISAGAGELIKRIETEKENPYGDVVLGALKKGEKPELLEEYVSENDGNMEENHQNYDKAYTPYIANGSMLLVNTDLIGDIEINGYEDLLNPALKGKIAAADPSGSSSAFAQLTNMLLAMGGDYTSDAGWDYVAALIENFDGKVSSGSSAVHKSVADGEYIVGLTYEDPSAAYIRDGAPVEIIYPKEGAVFLDGTVNIIKGATNLENAKKFVDFVISEEVQDTFGTELTNRPLRKDVKLGDHLKPLNEIHTIIEDEDYVKDHKDDILEKYIDIYTDAQ